MATITLLNVPVDLHERLKESAEQHRRSINNEAIVRLERSLVPHTRRSAEEAIAEAEELNRKIGRTFPDIVNEAKRKGRA